MHAWVMYSVLDCNVFKTKVHNPADRPLGTAMPGLEATAALLLMYGRIAACRHGLGMPMRPIYSNILDTWRLDARSTELRHAPSCALL